MEEHGHCNVPGARLDFAGSPPKNGFGKQNLSRIIAWVSLALLAAAPVGAEWNVRSAPFGARGDGETDDTHAFQRALDDAAAAGGGIVFVPAGRYRIATHLRVPPGVSLQGVSRAPQRFDPKVPGSTLLAVAGAGSTEGTPFLTLQGPNATLEGIAVFYPDQKEENPPAPYPWTIRGQGENVSLVNVLLVNPYLGVDFGTEKAARHFVSGLYGQPLHKGLWVDQCYDIGRVKNVHFWPFWSLDKKVIEYTTTHATGFIFQRSDWEVVEDIFVWGYRSGVELSASQHGAMNGQMANMNLDNVDVGIDITDTQPYAIHISNLNIANAGAGDRHIGIWGRPGGADHAELTIRGASFWGSLHQAIRWENPGVLSLSDSRIVQWTRKQPAIEILAGTAQIHGNSFRAWKGRTGPAFRVGAGPRAVQFYRNVLHGNQVDKPGRNVKAADNLP